MTLFKIKVKFVTRFAYFFFIRSTLTLFYYLILLIEFMFRLKVVICSPNRSVSHTTITFRFIFSNSSCSSSRCSLYSWIFIIFIILYFNISLCFLLSFLISLLVDFVLLAEFMWLTGISPVWDYESVPTFDFAQNSS